MLEVTGSSSHARVQWGLECDGVQKGQVTQVTLSPRGEGETALDIYRILPVVPPQREGAPKPAAVGWGGPGLHNSAPSGARERGELQRGGRGSWRELRCLFGWRAAI